MRDVHFSSQCVGVALVVSKLGLVGCYCGCRTPLMHWKNLSRLGFHSPRRDEYYCEAEPFKVGVRFPYKR
jgi:hypothetical protein